jgi:hypothetical protein
MRIDRRDILRSAIMLVGGAALPPEAWAFETAGRAAAFFDPPERSALMILCDTMMPRTDTPGALDAGVPAFLDTLMAGWASPAHQRLMREAIAHLTQAARDDTGKPLASLDRAERTAWLATADQRLIAGRDRGYAQFKRLVLTGYYYSEAGATQELRYELAPGVWEPAVPITADTRTWAA